MAEQKTDLQAGTLAQKDREDWLYNYGMPESTTDDDILMAIGSGFA